MTRERGIRSIRKSSTPIKISSLAALYSIFFAVLLWKVVATFVEPYFGYYGYVPRISSNWEIFSCILAVAILGAIVPTRWTRPSDYSRAFLTATFGIPVVLIPTFWGPSDETTVFTIHIVTVLVFMVIKVITFESTWNFQRSKIAPRTFWLVVSVFVAVSITYLFASTGISASILSLDDVYSQRDEYASSIGGIGAYLVGWVGSGILPAMLVAGLHYRARTLSIGAIIGILLLYSLTGYKSYLVGMILTVVGFILCSRRVRRGYGWFLGLGVAVSFAAIVDHLTDGFALTSLLVRRALSTAGLNTSFFFDYFKDNEHYLLRHSVFSFLGDPPSDLSPAKLIGLAYYGSERTAANANLIADGYANFGLLGCLGMAVVLGLYLRVFDGASAHLPLQISAPALTLVLVALSNTAALTTLTTHGGIIVLILVALMPSTNQSEINGSFKSKVNGVKADARRARRRRASEAARR